MAKSIIQNDALIYRFTPENLLNRCGGDAMSAQWKEVQFRLVDQGPHIYGYVYKIDIPHRGLYYIGQQKGALDLFYRGHGKWIGNYVKAHGVDDLCVTVLAWAYDKSGLDAAEYFCLGDRYRTDPCCMNLAPGGASHIGNGGSKGIVKRRSWTSEQKDKIRRSNLGQRRTEETRRNIGDAMCKVFSNPEIRKKISESRKRYYETHVNPMLGRQVSEETKRKISEARIGKKGPKFTQEHKDKIREAQKGFRHWTNGIINRFCVECPEGFWSGITAKSKLVRSEL